MASSSSSSRNMPPHHLLHLYGGSTAAPPPTPSSQQPTPSTATAAAADTLTRLLHRLPPTLSFPTRLSPRATPLPTTLTPTSFQLGYFQLTHPHHPISPQLAHSAESEATSLLNSPPQQNHALLPTDWPVGFDDDDDHTASFCFNPAKTTSESSAQLARLTELSRELEKVGLDAVEKLACTMGFENPFRTNGSSGHSSLMWVSLTDEPEKTGRVYPYVVGLQYQTSARKWRLSLDVGSVEVEPEVGSLLVTFGDIAQVWSNGKVNKVRGRPATVLKEEVRTTGSQGISMTMLLTLPMDSTVSPLLLAPSTIKVDEKKGGKEGNYDDQSVEASINNGSNEEEDEEGSLRVFNSFQFEDYAWRIYHERLHLKDPLDRYRRLR